MPDVDTINVVTLLLFAFGLVFGAISTIVRMLRLNAHHFVQPRLIWRDVSVFGLLAFDFLLIAMNRAFGWKLSDDLWWALLTSVLAIVAIGVYVYFELFVIGRVREKTDRDARDMTQDETEDLKFGNQRRALEAEHLEEDQ